jgi:hypothetical protein
MSFSTVSAIEAKKSQQDSTTTNDEPTANFGKFLYAISIATFSMLIMILVGANFISLMNFKSLSLLLPIEKSDYFSQSSVSKIKTSSSGVNNSMPCKYKTGKPSFSISMPRMADLGFDGNSHGWPYTMYNKNAFEFTFGGFKNWFAMTTAESYISLREILTLILSNEVLKALPPIVIFTTIAPLFCLLVPMFLPMFTSLFMLPFKGATYGTLGLAYTLIGLLFGWTSLMMGTNMVIQYTQVLFLFLIVPLIVDRDTVKSIIRCNSWWIGLMYALLVVICAFSTLGGTIGGIMFIAWIAMVFKQLNNA